jgi:glycosyltransferase involved in cell wall biosynthesis
VINVLFIAMEFAPVNTTGAFRSLAFTKYLRSHGINPVVVTLPEEQGVLAFSAKVDPHLQRELPPDLDLVRLPCEDGTLYYGTRYHRTRLRRFLTYYFSVEDGIGSRWRTQLDAALPDIIARYRPKAVYVSMPPFSAGRVAAGVAARYSLPLLVDMRDGWSEERVGAFYSWLHYWLTLRRERRIFARAERVVTVTPQLAQRFSKRHPRLRTEKFQVITNGFDFELTLPDVLTTASASNNCPFVIGYVGTFYYTPELRDSYFTPWWRRRLHRTLQYSPVKEDWLYRSPFFFLQALRRLLDLRPDLRGRVQFRVLGSNPTWLDEMAQALEVREFCEFRGRGSVADVRRFQSEVDALLCTAVKVLGGEDYCLASKTFEYLRAGKPLLGFTPRGAQRDFLKRSGLAVLVDPDDADAGAFAIERLLSRGYEFRPNHEFLQRYHRRVTTEQLARELTNALTLSGRGSRGWAKDGGASASLLAHEPHEHRASP